MSDEKRIIRREETMPEYTKETQFVSPLVDIYENDDEIMLIADMPGVGQEDISINLHQNELTLEGQRSNIVEGTILAAEYRPLDYRRAFMVPQGIDPNKIHAELKQGVMTIHLPKAEALKPRQIPIKSY